MKRLIIFFVKLYLKGNDKRFIEDKSHKFRLSGILGINDFGIWIKIEDKWTPKGWFPKEDFKDFLDMKIWKSLLV